MTTLQTGHVISVSESFIDPRPWAECSCGWKGPKHPCVGDAAAQALQDGRKHQQEATKASAQ